ncbi:hypothetical protein, partial [Mycolicibacterium peregrinum]|uniref:hypothetical protein n=1 Tax=Mycolicibacterium peregrinum TaxID=43304 RepID=UPI001054CE43
MDSSASGADPKHSSPVVQFDFEHNGAHAQLRYAHFTGISVNAPDIRSATVNGWSEIFGGWPNALQGSASAIISGVVAAATAFLVVRLTARADRKRALEDEARQVARELVRTLQTTFIGIPDQRSPRDDIETAAVLNLELRTAAAMLARHNQPLAQRIQDRADGLAEKAKRWRPDTAAAADTAAVGRYNEMYECRLPGS